MSKRRNSNGKRPKKKSRHKPFQHINVEERLREIFEGHVCWECGAPAERLKPYLDSNLPKTLKPYNYYCNECCTPTKGVSPEDKDYESVLRAVYHEPEVPEYEGADPWLFLEAYDEDEPDIHILTEAGTEYGEYRMPWRKGKFNSREYRGKEKKVKPPFKLPTGTGIYIQIDGKVFPWIAYHEQEQETGNE